MELKANELRLGNYIYSQSCNCNFPKGIIQVDFEAFRKIHLFEGLSGLSAIPLTEDILLKCGFKRRYNAPAMLLNYGELQSVFTINIVGDKFHFTYGDLEIEYLHQLQNLYFALTNEELNINL